ncbi:hypothetical protein NVP1089O_38 [Vibrio phage 1.089.O._10N.261.51.F9]|nr:hypothetical protein NVP1012O_38 [Vibrio phage 1.012.O._10N.261.48.C12]AUR86776.1 hypothetical protein NVP1089O_38 [Vibrio phage 1.089.O._10N.261.51.F9]AUR87282.1 hypothetical protein NVP1098O_38 [Vibrio phage 1.098.O._10N.286.51.B9]AUR88798.1 hypothetical protein NVP1118A_38 [Vibrio phage 1.118.A._10N.261.49.F6]AUR88894.1 hypothetical protein NVP1118B_38 [Vibrio phage 1.118.B._10N.261.49.F6]AUR91389.1 hypothetical protein NVP1160O_40 [Vibrio phage 1.160.O._10N.261.48.B11]AUR94502.1 hypoth
MIKTWLRNKLAGKELRELARLKQDINDLKVWCSGNKDVSAAAAWLENPKSYPCQYRGCHGDITDVREYLRKLDEDL